MTNQDFDPYHKWLGIPAREQPADHYRLLGVERFESDADVISMAADQRMNFLRQFHNGDRAAIAQKLLNEIAAARVCLLDTSKKIAYDKNLESRLKSSLDPSEISSDDLAATLEFSAPEQAPEWPSGPVAGSLVGADWAPAGNRGSRSQGKGVKAKSRKVNSRLITLALLSGFTLLLFLSLLAAFSLRESAAKKENSPSSDTDPAVASNSDATPDPQTPEVASANEPEPTDETEPPGANSKDQAVEDQRNREAEEKRKQDAERKKADEEANRQKQAEADRRAQKEKEEKEKAEGRRRKDRLKNRVDQCIAEAQQIRKNDPQQAIDILEDCNAAVMRAQVPPPFKQPLQRKLSVVQFSIRKQLAQQKARQISERKKNEEKIRKETPENYLESLGLVKQRNSWQIEAAGELEKMTKPLQSLIKKYKSKSATLKKRSEAVEKIEQGLRIGMSNIPWRRGPNPFKNREFQDWVLEGMPDYPDAPKPIRRRVDAGRAAFDLYREIAGPGAQLLLQEVNKYQFAKNKLEEGRDAIENILNELEERDSRARELEVEIGETKKRLEENQQYVDEALQSTGLDFKELELKGVRNALKKVNEILEDDPLDSFSDDDRRKD